MRELWSSIFAAKVGSRPKVAKCAVFGRDDTRSSETQTQSVLSATAALFAVRSDSMNQFALELEIAKVRSYVPGLAMKSEPANSDSSVADEFDSEFCRVEVISTHPPTGHSVLRVHFHQAVADLDGLSPGVAYGRNEFVTKVTHFRGGETPALTRPAIELIVMFETEEHQIVQCGIGRVPV